MKRGKLTPISQILKGSRDDWIKWAQEDLSKSLRSEININKAKNVILFLGDGMGISTITAARLYRSQLQKEKNIREGDAALEFEKFPFVGLSKTYNANRQTSGSASTATALLSGVKINQGTIGVDNTVVRHDCSSQTKESQLTSILDWSMTEGKSTGIISTARLSHASPAATYGHTASRAWEGDADMTNVTGNCKDLSLQLFEDNKNITVIMGGGRRTLLPKDFIDPQTNSAHSKQRIDGRNLIEEWKKDKQERSKSHSYITNKKQLMEVDASKTDYLLGVFSASHMDYEIDRDDSDIGQPSLAEMTQKAIQILKKNDNGFFLFVEAARIDHGHHATKAKKAIHDVLSFDDAVKAGMDETDADDTLIVVTGDHSHVFNIAGYPAIGNDIFEDKEYQQPAAVPVVDETHGGEDVAIFATGPMSHLFRGVHEQNYVAHVMAYASCLPQRHQAYPGRQEE
ncbi:hypothetical protein LOTGIDRAFT_179711 [Lottia gigantea]|uniref:alkaline phosphatase n=1 Tax=Lottia gigantea TaxID=225164 RepID=V3ZRV2_LOTGI|nr:hypothetical protein LOTGIDRAFT_179711 [Lottia gigantea]ESO83616.1 hypothetical protein LOTGIDRAFT_179711 [Lottia gigantea]